MKTDVMRINADIARHLLEKNKSNRPIRLGVVKKYAREMADGRWYLTHQGIAIYDNGDIADGQHRLMAVIESGVEIDTLVTFGIKRPASLGIDQHAVRAAHDAIKIASGKNVDKDIIAITRCLMVEIQPVVNSAIRPSASEIYDYYLENQSIIDYGKSFSERKVRGVTAAPVAASIAAAIFRGEDKIKIDRFCEVISTGEISGVWENAAIRLREYLMFNKAAWTSGADRRDSLKRAQRAINAFCSKEPLSRLITPKELIYAAPEWRR